MNTIRTLTALLIAFLGLAAPTASRAQSPDLRVLQAEYDNQLLDRVTAVYNAALAKLDVIYVTGLDRSFAEATKAGDLEGALSLQAEKKRLADREALPANDEKATNALKKLRAIYRAELAKLDAQRSSNQAAILPLHIVKLKQLEVELTKANRLADAKAVLDYRQGLAAGVPMKPSATVGATSPTPAKTPFFTPFGQPDPDECITDATRKGHESTAEGIVLHGENRFLTKKSYTPPVEITVTAKTDKQNLRLAYAADSVIFNWESNPTQLRVDGGPANKIHKEGAGAVPADQFVTIKWIVTRKSQTIFVDGEKRYEHEGDYSKIDKPVSVFSRNPSTVTLKSLKVKKMPR